MSSKSNKFSTLFRVSLVACTVLFLELLVIRMVSSEISIFAYLQNAILVSCFLALGMGLLIGKDITVNKSILPLAILAACCLEPTLAESGQRISGALSLFHDFPVWDERVYQSGTLLPMFLGMFGTFAYLFTIWAVFIPLGAELGRQMDRCKNVNLAYSADIFGSLCGVIFFSLLSAFSISPSVWLLIGVTFLFCITVKASLRKIDIAGIIVITSLITLRSFTSTTGTTIWSPYQKLQIEAIPEEPLEWRVSTNNTGLQQIQSVISAQKQREKDDFPPQRFSQYDLPGLLSPHAQRVLVVGAGTGNDVAGILRQTPNAQVTAVELDPQLIQTGRIYNADHPYSSPSVHVIYNDARAFFDTAKEQFDLIVFGLLDSHTTPNISNARLDNFVYTHEGIQKARQLLAPNGLLFLIFQVQRDYIGERLSNVLAKSFDGQHPRAYLIENSPMGWGGLAFISGDFSRIDTMMTNDSELKAYLDSRRVIFPVISQSEVLVTTDNWPYLYIFKPTIPSLFWVLGGMLLILWIFTSYISQKSIVLPNFSSIEHRHFFCMGAAFSLMQVYLLSRAAVMFGSTWFVNTVVSIGILLGILVANSLSTLLPSKVVKGCWVILMGVAALYGLQIDVGSSSSFLVQFTVGVVICAIPTMLSGILFARTFSRTELASKSLGANLFGALIGAVLQLLSFRFGIGSLALSAALFYAFAGVWMPSWESAKRDHGNPA